MPRTAAWQLLHALLMAALGMMGRGIERLPARPGIIARINMRAPDVVIGSGIQTPGLRGMRTHVRDFVAFDVRRSDVPLGVRRIGPNAE